jgi:hypothetical protein
MFRPAYALLLLLAVPLAAQELPDISAAIALDRTSALTGERVSGTLTVRNRSAFASPQAVTAEVALDPRQQEITLTGPEGWSCIESQCRTETFPANAQATLRFELLTRNDLPSSTVRVTGHAYLSDQDPDPSNNQEEAILTLAPHPATAALSVHGTAQQSPVPALSPVVVTFDIRNHGPAAASQVRVQFTGVGPHHTTVIAPGWTCSEFVTECSRPTLGAGESAPITVGFVPLNDAILAVRAKAGAELSFDPDSADNEATVTVAVGDASRWERILLPVVLSALPGLNGSLWETEVTAVIGNGTNGIFPRECTRNSCLIPIPVGVPFQPSLYGIAVPSSRPARFLYSAAGQMDRMTFNLRVRDLNRTSETWGTEVPAVREHAFRTTPITLAPLPVDPLFRTTVRVYDFDARAGAQVAVHIYADQEATPRTTLVRTFTTWPGTVTTVSLPEYPGYLQLDLGEAGTALEGAETAWIRIEPRTEGLRFWAFASVTNNPTGHVTTVTPR